MTESNPEGKPYYITLTSAAGCDSTVYLYLTVNNSDTADIEKKILNSQLPYKVDEYYTVPENTPVGGPYEYVIRATECKFHRYIITVEQCIIPAAVADTVCYDTIYNGYGFSLSADSLPEPGQSKNYTRSNMGEAGCDSLITLSLMMLKPDTIVLPPVEINEDALPYTIQGYTIPAIKAGVYTGVFKMPNECTYYSYSLTVHEIGWGIVNITDDIDYIEVYDLLGRKIQTISHDEDMNKVIPTGVYMLHTVLKSGQAINSKVAIQ